MRSATRAGWFWRGGVCTMPWPRRMFSVRCDAAARKTSGAEEWLYSSRKWCSVSNTYSKPSSSANSICSRASWNVLSSASGGSHWSASSGLGVCSWKLMQTTIRLYSSQQTKWYSLHRRNLRVGQKDMTTQERRGRWIHQALQRASASMVRTPRNHGIGN